MGRLQTQGTHHVLAEQGCGREQLRNPIQDESAHTRRGMYVRTLGLKNTTNRNTAALKKTVVQTPRPVTETGLRISRFARALEIHRQAWSDQLAAML